jgi:O-antigen/teichoic acid export membrane protein
MFVGMFLWTYLLSASRIAVDNVLPSEYQSYYQVLFMPICVINLFAGFLIRPSLIHLTELYADNKMREFWKIIWKMIVLLIAFTVVCMAGAYICGIPILSLLVNCKLDSYRIMFVFLIFAGGFNAIAYLLYYVLTIFRNRLGIMLGYGIASVVALLISTNMTRRWQLWGASMSYLVSIVVLMVVFVGCIIFSRRRGEVHVGINSKK